MVNTYCSPSGFISMAGGPGFASISGKPGTANGTNGPAFSCFVEAYGTRRHVTQCVIMSKGSWMNGKAEKNKRLWYM